MSLISNIAFYLVTQYNLRGIYVVNVVNIWYGTSNIASIAGAYISDAYLGRFRTLLLGSVASLLVIKVACSSFLFLIIMSGWEWILH